MNPLTALQARGQSVWLDFIRRNHLESGDLATLVADGVRGVTSNPSIFEKAIAGSDDYDAQIREILAAEPGIEAARLFERLAVVDIRDAADILRPVYDASDGADGFVSLEVSPRLADDTERTVAEAKRLWAAVDRPNLMIKVPATPAGVPAIETLIASGINVNVTLIFGLAHYEAIATSYLRGLAALDDPSRVASVASFFVSRVDTATDPALEAIGTEEATSLLGTAAVANARLAYQLYLELFGESFADLAARGAKPQRVLWASTSTKNPAYSDVKYVEELVGPGTVNTIPPETLVAFRDHGVVPGDTILERPTEAAAVIDRLFALDIDFDLITQQLQEDGVAAFAASYDDLLSALVTKTARLDGAQVLDPGDNATALTGRLAAWDDADFTRRLWEKDYTLWVETPQPEISDRLGWLTLPAVMRADAESYREFADNVRADGIAHVVLMGMGGSSLAPEVYQRTFGNAPGYPELVVLDSTHPAAVRSVADRIDPAATLFILASKSGTTLEPLSFFRYFWDQVAAADPDPGRHFVAITDPGSSLLELAEDRGFRRVFEAVPDVGGRYSALTAFGLVPAALIGVDLDSLLDRAETMAALTAPGLAATDAVAVQLGAMLGELALVGRDKATFLVSSTLEAFPDWAEQLIAESTGKDGIGILPIAGEAVGPPEVYGDDRVFIYLVMEGDDDADQAGAVGALAAAGHPVATIRLRDASDLGGEMFRAEVAVAAAGSVLGIHPFNQPDVEVAKVLARKAMAGEALGDEPVQEIAAGEPAALRAAVGRWLEAAQPGDYLALQAYLAPDASTMRQLEAIRMQLRDRLHLATTLGYGPRFLHSTGQLHKGGQPGGLFLQLVDEPSPDLAVPETDYTFGELIAAQAVGDYYALTGNQRRVLRINLGTDVADGIAALAGVLDA